MIKTIRNLATKSLEQQLTQPQSFTFESDENCHIFNSQSSKRQESNLNNNSNIMNTSAMNDKWGAKSADVIPKKSKSNSISETMKRKN